MKRNTILHGVGALMSALIYAFFALPYYTIKISPKEIIESATNAGVQMGRQMDMTFLKTL